MPYSAAKVANELLRLAAACDPPRPVTPLQLIKLTYIANGWSLAIEGVPLVNEFAEAWTYGPVMPSLYRAIRRFRASSVEGVVPDNDPQDLSERDRDLIAAVYQAYGQLSGPQLSNMTHMADTPWSVVWADGAGQNQLIPSDLIRNHYLMLRARQTTDAAH